MDSLLDFGLTVSRWLQETYPQLAGVMRLFTDLGRFEVYLALLPLLYWCLNKRLGIYLSYLLILSTVLNGIGKQLIRGPRPFWLEPQLGLIEEISYGIPSGHAQTATVVAGFLAGWFRKRWLWTAAVLYILIMGFTRIYLGVHFVHDVVAGILLGALILTGFALWQRFLGRWFRSRLLGQRLLPAAGAPLALLVLYVATILWLRGPDPSVDWAAFQPAAELEGWESTVSYLAMMLGAGVGFMFESNRVGFLVSGPIWKRALRYLLGIAVAIVIWRGLGIVFLAVTPRPEEMLWLALPLRFVRYLVLGAWIAYYAPWSFVKLKLAERSAEPETPFTIEGASLKNTRF